MNLALLLPIFIFVCIIAVMVLGVARESGKRSRAGDLARNDSTSHLHPPPGVDRAEAFVHVVVAELEAMEQRDSFAEHLLAELKDTQKQIDHRAALAKAGVLMMQRGSTARRDAPRTAQAAAQDDRNAFLRAQLPASARIVGDDEILPGEK